jgi:phenylacetate-CoA ligase
MSDLALRSYYAMPAWAQSLALSAYGLRLRFLRYGRYNRRVLAELLRSQWFSRDQLQELQVARLNALLGHAATNIPYYRALGFPDRVATLDDLRGLPVLRKAEVRRSAASLVAGGRRGALGIHTGGTTGTPLNIACDRRTLQRNYAFFARLRHWAGAPRGRMVTFGGRTFLPPRQAAPPYWRRNATANILMMSSYHIAPHTLDAYINRLRSFHPDLIDAYPSSIEPIARRLVAVGDASIRLRAVVTSSETLFPPVRQAIERAFGCRVFDYYGAGEMAAFVSQCEAGSYHVNPEFGIVELLRDGVSVGPGETGEITATGFINPVMPLIRYATGDEAVQGSGDCVCGRAFPVVQRLAGRMDDVLITPEGRYIGRLDPIFKSVSSLHEARVVQDASDHVRLEVVPDVGFSANEAAGLVQELERRLGPSMRVDLVRVKSIPREASGKLRMVVREPVNTDETPGT